MSSPEKDLGECEGWVVESADSLIEVWREDKALSPRVLEALGKLDESMVGLHAAIDAVEAS